MVLLLVALLAILLLLPLAAGQRFEKLTPPFAFALMAALLPFAMVGRLSAFVWFALAAAAALAGLAVWRCLRNRTLIGQWPRLLLTPGFACFVLLAVLLWFSAEPRMVWWGDDIRYWALPTAAFLLLFPTHFNSFAQYALCVDASLGLCFGYALCQLWRMREDPSSFRLTCFTLALCAMVLLKQAGALLVLLTVAFLPVARLKGKLKASRWLMLYGVPLFLFIAWVAYCRANGLNGMHTASLLEQLGEMLRGAWQPPEGFALLPGALWHGLTSDLHGFSYMEWQPLVEAPCLLTMLFLCLLPLALIPLACRRSTDDPSKLHQSGA